MLTVLLGCDADVVTPPCPVPFWATNNAKHDSHPSRLPGSTGRLHGAYEHSLAYWYYGARTGLIFFVSFRRGDCFILFCDHGLNFRKWTNAITSLWGQLVSTLETTTVGMFLICSVVNQRFLNQGPATLIDQPLGNFPAMSMGFCSRSNMCCIKIVYPII